MLPTPTPPLEVLSIIPPVSMIPVWFTEGAKWLTIIAGVVTSIVGILKLVARPLQTIGQKIDTVDAKVAAVDTKLATVQDDVGDIQCHLLNQAYDEHMDTGWCSRDEKDRLTEMCGKYTGRGRNHLRPQYVDALGHLPEAPPEKPKAKRPAQKKAPPDGAGQAVNA